MDAQGEQDGWDYAASFVYEPSDEEMEQAFQVSEAMTRAELARSRDMMADDPFYGLTLKGVPRRAD